jgi:hypothetical protein
VSVAILISGSIFKEPMQRTSQAGRRFVVTTLKVSAADNSTSDFWSVLAFGDTAGAELMRLAVGERVTIQGGLKLQLFEKDGQARISRTIFADHVMALRAPPRERKPKKAAADATPEKETAAGGPAFFSDKIPFEAAR